jgi:hypothetical protein
LLRVEEGFSRNLRVELFSRLGVRVAPKNLEAGIQPLSALSSFLPGDILRPLATLEDTAPRSVLLLKFREIIILENLSLYLIQLSKCLNEGAPTCFSVYLRICGKMGSISRLT